MHVHVVTVLLIVKYFAVTVSMLSLLVTVHRALSLQLLLVVLLVLFVDRQTVSVLVRATELTNRKGESSAMNTVYQQYHHDFYHHRYVPVSIHNSNSNSNCDSSNYSNSYKSISSKSCSSSNSNSNNSCLDSLMDISSPNTNQRVITHDNNYVVQSRRVSYTGLVTDPVLPSAAKVCRHFPHWNPHDCQLCFSAVLQFHVLEKVQALLKSYLVNNFYNCQNNCRDSSIDANSYSNSNNNSYSSSCNSCEDFERDQSSPYYFQKTNNNHNSYDTIDDNYERDVKQHLLRHSSDSAVLYLSQMYQSIRSHRDDLQTKTTNSNKENLHKDYSICVVGIYSPPVLLAIAVLNPNARIKYFTNGLSDSYASPVVKKGKRDSHDSSTRADSWLILSPAERKEVHYLRQLLLANRTLFRKSFDIIDVPIAIYVKEFLANSTGQSSFCNVFHFITGDYAVSTTTDDTEMVSLQSVITAFSTGEDSGTNGVKYPVIWNKHTSISDAPAYHRQWRHQLFGYSSFTGDSKDESTTIDTYRPVSFIWQAVGNWYDGIINISDDSIFGITCGTVKNFALSSGIDHVWYGYATLLSRKRDMSSPISSQECSINSTEVFITYEDHIFVETAYGFRSMLALLPFRKVDVYGRDWLSQDTEYNSNKSGGNKTRCGPLQLVLSSHLPVVLAPKYILIHTENSWSTFLYSALTQYQILVEHALAIFVYSSVHQQLLVERFNRSANVYLLPLYSVRLYNYSTFDSNNNNKGPFLITKETSTDILFTGSVSERRMTFLNELNRLAIEKSISLLIGKESAWFETGKISLIDIHTKEFVAATTKVVINFHQQRHSVLETHRIMHLLSYGKCIVSERSLVDPLLDSVYEDRDEGTTNPNGTTAHDTNRAIVFVPLHSTSQEIFQIALYFVRNDTARQLVEERARNLYAKVMGNRLLMHSTISKIFNAN